MKTASAVCSAAMFCMLGSGCAGWKATTKTILADTHKAAKELSVVAEPAFDQKCSDVAHKCKAVKDTECKPLVDCEDQFKKFNRAVTAVHYLVATGYSLLALDARDSMISLVLKLGNTMKGLYALANEFGVISWKL